MIKETKDLLSADILALYDFSADSQVKAFGNGHINSTYLVQQDSRKLILQQINTAIFPQPALLVDNALLIERHLSQKQRAGLYPLQILRQQASNNGQYLVGPAADIRALAFIEDGCSLEVVQQPAEAYAAAFTFGQFGRALSDFPVQTLHTVIPNFHDLGMRYQQLQQAIKNNKAGRLPQCQDWVDFALTQQLLVSELTQTCATLPLRVCHNDTKINNMLYSTRLERGIAAIDLDTCMSGYWLFDFGDMVRTCCSPVAEDSLDHAQVRIRPEIFSALSQGYLAGLGDAISTAEVESLWLGAKVMCLMIGVRFLTDYLNGDCYFAVHRPNHNLQRARNQFSLYQSLVAQQHELQPMLRFSAN